MLSDIATFADVYITLGDGNVIWRLKVASLTLLNRVQCLIVLDPIYIVKLVSLLLFPRTTENNLPY